MVPMFVIKHNETGIEISDQILCPECKKEFSAKALLSKTYVIEKELDIKEKIDE